MNRRSRGYCRAGILALFVASVALSSSACWKKMPRQWEVKGAQITTGTDDRPLLLVHLHSPAPWKRTSRDVLLSLDVATGKRVGTLATTNWVRPFGLTRERLWIQQGDWRTRRWTAYRLPDLKQVVELGGLLRKHRAVARPVSRVQVDPRDARRIVLRAGDGSWYVLSPGEGSARRQPPPDHDPFRALAVNRCEDPPSPPRRVKSTLLLDGAYVCDNTAGKLVVLGARDRLVAYQDLKKEMGKLILGRLSDDGKWAWRLKEQDWFMARPRKDHGYRVVFAARRPDGVVLVLQQHGGGPDVWVLSLNPASGAVRWKVRHDG